MRILIATALASLTCYCFRPLLGRWSNRPGSGAALGGQVTSAEEGAMEGVLVSAKKAGSTITITVASDAQGRYSFPAASSSLANTRCASARSATISTARGRRGRRAEATSPISSCARPRTSPRSSRTASGSRACPGTDQQKSALLNCIGCHTLERVMQLDHTTDDLHAGDAAAHAGLREPEHPGSIRSCGARERLMEERGDQRVQVYRALADYLATINLSNGALELCAEDAAAPEGPRHARHHHRIRSAARDHPAA